MEEPRRRPQSALHFAMALPGGDPVAAALAAGETPSPEMVAASQEREGFNRRVATICFVAILVSVVALQVIPRNNPLRQASLEIPPQALADRAQAMLRKFGYGARPASVFYGFRIGDPVAWDRVSALQEPRRRRLLAAHQPAVVSFWYRQHSSEIVAEAFPGSVIRYDSPANEKPGMIRLDLDATGRLLTLEARPDDAAVSGTPAAPDWNQLLLAAGLDATRFTPVAPRETPPVMADQRMAWTGTFGPDGTEQARVEAAAWKGRPVYFRVSGDWYPQGPPSSAQQRSAQWVGLALWITILVGAPLLARRNLLQGRGDQRGAVRVATGLFVGYMCVWVLLADHTSPLQETALLVRGLSFGTLLAVGYGVVYLAAEPYARRYWPDALIAVTRLLAGRIRDPLVASNVMAGILLTQVAAVVLFFVGLFWPATVLPEPIIGTLIALKNVSSFAGVFILAIGIGATIAGLLFFAFVVLRIWVRRDWIANASMTVLAAFLGLPGGPAAVVFNTLVIGAGIWMLRRLGVLAFLVSGAIAIVGHVFSQFSYSPGSWYADRALILPVVVIASASWALWVIVSDKGHQPTGYVP